MRSLGFSIHQLDFIQEAQSYHTEMAEESTIPVSVGIADIPDQCRSIIARSFCPKIAVTASDDTIELCREMGFESLLDLLAPFGDTIEGKVTIRDSQQLSVTFDDFSVRFIGDIPKSEVVSTGSDRTNTTLRPPQAQQLFDIAELEQKLSLLLQHEPENPSKIYLDTFKDLVSNDSAVPFETFGHPVAGVIAITSRNGHPIDTLSTLYKQSHSPSIAGYINKDYLRYYVLVHDEQGDDLEKSTALFEKMKRHFGLHCYMVQVNRSFSESDCQAIGKSIWDSSDPGDDSEARPKLSKEDVVSLKGLTRELVTQSVIPFMERSIATWNDQIASSRRGFTGRLFSASRKYFASSSRATNSILSTTATAFGGGTNFPFSLSSSSSPSPSPPPDGPNSSSSSLSSTLGSLASVGSTMHGNYNASLGFYGYLAPEAQIRKLADFAFMLRDYRFAFTTYELLRRDFHNDKAWFYLAASQEMAVASYLMYNTYLPTKSRLDVIDPLLDSAVYSYISRCQQPSHALRCILIASELMCTSQTPSASSEGSTRWVLKAMNERLVGRLGYAMLMERIAGAYASYDLAVTHYTNNKEEPINITTNRSRKRAFWQLLAAREWLDADQPKRSAAFLDQCETVYGDLLWTKDSALLLGRLKKQLHADKNHEESDTLDTGIDDVTEGLDKVAIADE